MGRYGEIWGDMGAHGAAEEAAALELLRPALQRDEARHRLQVG